MELQRFLNGEPILARPISRTARCWRWSRRNPVVASLTAIVAVTLLAGIAISTYFAIEAQHRAVDEAKQRQEAERQTAVANDERQRAASERNRAEWLLYTTQIAFAQRDWETDNLSAAREHLAATREDLRGWEYNYLAGMFRGRGQVLSGHAKSKISLAVSRDGKTLVSRGSDSIKLWDSANGKERRTLPVEARSQCIAISPNGLTIAGGWGSSVKVWDAVSGQELHTLKGHGRLVNSVAYSPDGKWIASGGQDKTVRLWDAESGALIKILQGHRVNVQSVVFSPTGGKIASCGYIFPKPPEIKLWDTASAVETVSIQGEMTGFTEVAFSPDEERIAVSTGDRTIEVWNAMNGEKLLTIRGPLDAVTCVAINSNGSRIAGGSRDHSVRVWNMETGEELSRFKGHDGEISGVAFLPGEDRVVSAGADGLVRIWKPQDVDGERTLEGTRATTDSVTFSPNSSRIVSGGGDRLVRVWDAVTGEPLMILRGHASFVRSVSYDPNGSWIASADMNGTLKVWDAETGEERQSFQGGWPPIAARPNSQELLYRGEGKTLKTYNVLKGREQESSSRPIDGMSGLSVSLDGNFAAGAYRDSAIRPKERVFSVWNLSTAATAWTKPEHVKRSAFSPNGRLLAGTPEKSPTSASDASAVIWDLASGQKLRTLFGHAGEVNCIDFSPDGSRIVTGSSDRTLILWDTKTGQAVLTLRGHRDGITCAAFSPDGQRIVSGASGKLKVWEIVSGNVVAIGEHRRLETVGE